MTWVNNPNLGSKNVFKIRGSIQMGTAYKNLTSKFTTIVVRAIIPDHIQENKSDFPVVPQKLKVCNY